MPSPSSAVRVRFAPSPTGYLHVGGVRTALFNWLWARRTGGIFILRIEDTDRERSTPENERVILESMRWLGLDWDEGPEVGGSFGPYRQMERLPIYQEFVQKLLRAGAAYRCFCSEEELDSQRAALKAKDSKAEFRYPGTCRDRGDSPDRPFVIRLRAPTSGAITYRDRVFGSVTTPNSAQQDWVLTRSDGVPLYNLGSVVDDITMGVTLVARGRDHMVNTPVQILLYQALGTSPPEFAHLPMLLNQSGEKLSKRDGAASVAEYREMGIPPTALLNYLVRFGWSFGDEEVFSRSDLVRKFDWERCGQSDGKVDPKKLQAISFAHLKSPELISDDSYAAGMRPFLTARGLAPEDDALRASLPLYRDRAKSWVEAAEMMDYLFRDPPTLDETARDEFIRPEHAASLAAVADYFASASDFSLNALRDGFTAFLTGRGLKMKHVAQPVRVALTGRTASPGLLEVAVLLGKERVLERLRTAATAAQAFTVPSGAGGQ